jgi:DNA-binding SARP family transcriptional activator
MMVYVKLFGAFAVKSEPSMGIALSSAQKRIAAYLFSFPNELHRRDKLLDLFWADSSPSRARHSLSMALCGIRSLVLNGGNADISLRSSLYEVGLTVLDPTIVDVHRFRAATSKAYSVYNQPTNFEALARAIDLYGGLFLEEYDEDWVLIQREDLQTLYLRSLTQLMKWNAGEQRYEESIACGRRILASDPTRENIHRALMLIHLIIGQRGEALRQFTRCEKALRDECDAAVTLETRSLLGPIRSGEVPERVKDVVQKELHFAS